MIALLNRRCLALAMLAVLAMPAIAGAQTSNDPPRRRLEAAFAAGWLGGGALGAADANLRTRDGGEYLLFRTDSRFVAAPMVEARVAYPLTPRYTVEGRFGFSHPDLRSTISADVENAPALRIEEPIDRYTVEAALVVMLNGLRFGSLVPFASAGAGYLRQLHEGRTLVEEGVVYQIGGGVKHQLFGRERGFVKAGGLRGDVRLHIATGGIELDGGAQPHAGASGGLYVIF